MYILSGIYRKRSIQTPKGSITRPSTTLLRKALFDIARPIVEGACCLDLFAGSGAMGLEALSRGALEITFIEKDPNACACITENLRRFGILKAHFRLLKGEALTQLLRLAKKGERFDLITIDPPYDLAPQLIPEILQCIDERHLLERGGLLFLEAGKNLELLIQALSLRALHLKEVRRYGRTHLHIFVPMEKM